MLDLVDNKIFRLKKPQYGVSVVPLCRALIFRNQQTCLINIGRLLQWWNKEVLFETLLVCILLC